MPNAMHYKYPVPFILHSVRTGADITSEHETLFDAVREAHLQDERGYASPGFITLTDPRSGEVDCWDKQWINNCQLEHLCGTCHSVKPTVRSIVVAGQSGDRVERICSDCDMSLRRALRAALAESNPCVRQESENGVVHVWVYLDRDTEPAISYDLATGAPVLNVPEARYNVQLALVTPSASNPDHAETHEQHFEFISWSTVLQVLELKEIDVLHTWTPAAPPADE